MTQQTLFAPLKPSEVLLIDLANMAYRNAHAGSSMTTSDGRPSGHIYLTIKALVSLRRRHPYASMMFALDAPRTSTFRAEMYPDYKAQRHTSLDYNPVVELEAFVACMKCDVAMADGYEADDVIAAMVARQELYRYIVISNDKDLWSLLQYNNVTILNPRDPVGPQQMHKAFGDIPPHKIAMFKAILGDASDNIPKVPRLRKKKVAELLNVSSTLDDVFEKAKDIMSPKETEKLIAHEEMVRTNLKLSTLQTMINPQIIANPGSATFLDKMFKHYEVSSLYRDMQTLLS